MVQNSGSHDVPLVGKVNMLSYADMARFARWSLLYSLTPGTSPEEALAIRQLVSRVKGFLKPEDLVMLAEVVREQLPWLAEEFMKVSGGG